MFEGLFGKTPTKEAPEEKGMFEGLFERPPEEERPPLPLPTWKEVPVEKPLGLFDWEVIKEVPKVWKEEPERLKFGVETASEKLSIIKIFNFFDKKFKINEKLEAIERKAEDAVLSFRRKIGIPTVPEEEMEKIREEQTKGFEEEQRKLAELKAENPQARAIGNFGGELLDIAMLYSAVSKVTAPIAPIAKGIIVRKLPQLALTTKGATLLRILSYGAQSAPTFSTISLIKEGANQMEQEKFSPTKLAGAGLRGAGWGAMVAVPHALPASYLRISGAFVMGSAWTTIETLIKNKQLTKEDILPIARDGAILAIFEAVNSRAVTGAYKSELIANQSKWRMENKVGKEASDLISKLDLIAIQQKGTPQGKLALSARNKVMAETMLKRDVNYVIAKEVAAGQWKVISPTTKGKSLSELLTPAEKTIIQHIDQLWAEPAPISIKLLEPNPRVREAHINYPDIISRIDLKLGFVVPSRLTSIPALPAPSAPYIPPTIPTGPPIPAPPPKEATTTELVTALTRIKEIKTEAEKEAMRKAFTERMREIGWSEEMIRGAIKEAEKPTPPGVPEEAKPEIELKAPPFIEEVEVKERPTIERLIPRYEDMTEQQSNVVTALELAQKGERFRVVPGDQVTEDKWLGMPSTFPDYLSVKSKKVIESVLEHIKAGTVPTKYDEVRVYNDTAKAMGVVKQAREEIEREIDVEEILGKEPITEERATAISEKIDRLSNEQETIISKPEVKLPEVPKEEVRPEKEIKEVKPIPKELEPLAVEARKYKSAEEFVEKGLDRELYYPMNRDLYNLQVREESNIEVLKRALEKKGTPEQIKNRQTMLKTSESVVEKVKALRTFGFNTYADFYTQAVKGVKEVKPEVWEMTQKEYLDLKKPVGRLEIESAISRHKSAIKEALERGEKVPRQVLKDYPNIKQELKKEIPPEEYRSIMERIEEKVKPEVTKAELETEEKAEGLFEEKIPFEKVEIVEKGRNVQLFDNKKEATKFVTENQENIKGFRISTIPDGRAMVVWYWKDERQFFEYKFTDKGRKYLSAYRQMEVGKAITGTEAIQKIRELFTDKEIQVQIQKDFILTPKGTKAIAASYNNMIRFVENATRANIPDHESLHTYFRLYATPARRSGVINEMRKKYPFHTLEDLNEQLADNFVRWRLKLETFTGRIEEFFRGFWRFLQRFFRTTPKSNITQLYEDIVAKRRPAEIIATKEVRMYKEAPLSDDEIEAFDFIQNGKPMPERLDKVVEDLKKKGVIRESYVSPTEAKQIVKSIKKGTKRMGTIREGQIEAIEAAVEEKKLARNVFSMMRNRFTGHKRTRIEELSEKQADELFEGILDLTPTKWGKIQIVTPEVLEVMGEFIPPALLKKPFITTGEIYQHIDERQVGYIASLARPVRKVLTSGEIEPNQKKMTERIYDKISTAEEDSKLDYRNWHRRYVEMYNKAKKEDKNVDVNVFANIERKTEVPENTRKLTTFLKRWYGGTLPVMKPKRVRRRYITHTEETFWEKTERAGFIHALREVVRPNIDPSEKIDPGIIANLDYIVAKEKFNPYALPRAEYRAYSKKLMKATHAYAKLYYYKKHFDPIMPDILKMKRFLPGSTQKYITKYLQTVGGRPLDYTIWKAKIMGVPVGRWAKRAINTGIRFEYGILLGLNVSSGLGNVTGGGWNNIADIPPGRLALGHQRLATPQGWKILDKYGLTAQSLYLEPVGGMIDQLTKGERALFTFMQAGEFYLRGSASLGIIPEEEFKSAKLSPLTRGKIRRQISRTQGLFGPAQAPLLSQVTLTRPLWMFKHWMVNEIELWHSFSKEAAIRIKRNPGWMGKTIKNPGLRRLTKYIIIGALLFLFGPEFLKKEVKQKMGIPKTLVAGFVDWLKAPLVSDLWLAAKLTVRVGYGEFREAREEIYQWVMRKPMTGKFKMFFEGFFKGEITTPSGELTERVDRAEAFKRWMLGSWTKQAQTERRLNEELSKLLPTEYYIKWDWDLGPRKIKTGYQKTKEDVMNYIKKKGYWDIKELTLAFDKEIERIFSIYNGKALKKLDKFLAEREKLTGEPLLEKEYNSLRLKVTIQESDIVRWYETLYETKTVPRILRRTR